MKVHVLGQEKVDLSGPRACLIYIHPTTSMYRLLACDVFCPGTQQNNQCTPDEELQW